MKPALGSSLVRFIGICIFHLNEVCVLLGSRIIQREILRHSRQKVTTHWKLETSLHQKFGQMFSQEVYMLRGQLTLPHLKN